MIFPYPTLKAINILKTQNSISTGDIIESSQFFVCVINKLNEHNIAKCKIKYTTYQGKQTPHSAKLIQWLPLGQKFVDLDYSMDDVTALYESGSFSLDPTELYNALRDSM